MSKKKTPRPLPVPETNTIAWTGEIDPPPPLNDTSTIPYEQMKRGRVRVWPWVLLFVAMLAGSALCWHYGLKWKAQHPTTIKR